MAKLVQLEGPDGAAIYVNPDLINIVRISLDHPGCTELVMEGGATQDVLGKVEDVVAQMELL